MNRTTHDKSFATPRQSSTVRNRCILFIETLHKLGYERIPIDQAKQLFSLTVNVFDRVSIKAYFGTYQHVSTHSIQREARYQSGAYSFKTIVLKQKVPYQLGYLDLLGLVTYEWINKTLFLIPKFGVLVPTLMKGSEESIGEFSLSFSQGERARENRFEKVVSPSEAEESNVLLRTPTNNNNLGGEREIAGYTNSYTKNSLQKDLLMSGPKRNDSRLEEALGHKAREQL